MEAKKKSNGNLIVSIMFLFAVLVTAGLWGYWNFHTAPFRQLTETLANKFPESSPRVEGGKHGMHKETPSVLRVVMRVSYNPDFEEDLFQTQVQEILAVVKKYKEIEKYSICEIHLFHHPREEEHKMRSVTIPLLEANTSNGKM